MHIKMGKLQTIFFVITCWLTAFTVMFQLPEGVVVSDIYQAFPNDAAIVTAMLSLPSLMTAVASLIGGALLKKTTTKMLLIVSGICCLVMLAAPIPNSALILFLCTMVAAIGALASYLAGILAMNGWKCFSQVYWIVVPMLILSILFLPNIKPEDRPVEQEEAGAEAEAGKKGFGKTFWIFFASMFLFFMVYVPVSTYIFVDAAVISAAMVAPSAPVAVAVCVVCGASYGVMFSYCYAYAAEAVPLSRNAMAMGIMTFCYSVGMAVGVYLVDFSMAWFGGSMTRALVIQIALCLIGLALECVRNLSSGKKGNSERKAVTSDRT